MLMVIAVINTSTGCSTYNLTPVNSSDCRGCVQVSADGKKISQIPLSDLLSGDLINSTDPDCVNRLQFGPGRYQLTGTNITVKYSIGMISVGGDAVIACAPSGNTSLAGKTSAQILFRVVEVGNEAVQQNRGTVELEGISFQDCQHSLQFDHLEHIIVRGCQFR